MVSLVSLDGRYLGGTSCTCDQSHSGKDRFGRAFSCRNAIREAYISTQARHCGHAADARYVTAALGIDASFGGVPFLEAGQRGLYPLQSLVDIVELRLRDVCSVFAF